MFELPCKQEGGTRVGAITEKTHLSRPAVSHHIKILKDAGVVGMRKEGTKNYYYLETDNRRCVFCNRKVQRNAIKNAEVCHPFNSFSTMRGTVYSSRHEKR
ncbi:metalloregulator ArsR/SmtB family transcription factor [Enterococcus cecorum]|uniref:ArsR/SmtB family transcription factor n=1 Tax=Enterococcus cecorum TaxID=44008 RepID=UPI00311A9982